jgi:MarC family integral membrane protein
VLSQRNFSPVRAHLTGLVGLRERWKVSVNEMIGTTVLLYGLINPVGVAPIYLSLVRRISPDRAHRIIVVSSATVAGLLAAAAGFGREIPVPWKSWF